MALQIGEAADNTARWKSPVRLYTTDAGRIVEAAVDGATTLFMAEGAELSLKDAQRLGLVDRYPQVNVVVDEATTVPRAELNAALEHWARQESELQITLHAKEQALSEMADALEETGLDLKKARDERDTANAAAKRLEAENSILRDAGAKVDAENITLREQLANAVETPAAKPDAAPPVVGTPAPGVHA